MVSTPGNSDRRIEPRREGDRDLLRAQRELEAARRISELLFESPVHDQVVERALIAATEVVGAEGGSILLADPSTGRLVFQHSIGIKPVPAGTSFPSTEGIAGHVFRTGEPLIIHDVARDERHLKLIDRMTDYVTHDLIAAPLRHWKGETIGVIEVLNKRQGRFDENDLHLLLIVCAISASAIERARLNEEVRLAEISTVFSRIGHDIKNLLTPVVMGSGLLDEMLQNLFSRLSKTEQRAAGKRYARSRKLIASFTISSNRIQLLLKEFTDCVIGISSPLHFVPCRLDRIVGEVYEVMGQTARKAGVGLLTRGLEDLPEIEADENRLFNAFYNLVNNAVSATPSKGTITVSGEQDVAGGGLRLSVADTGRGMPAEVAAGLFTGTARSRKQLGSGLGIKIVKDVVDAHHGRIEVRSRVGGGTTFDLFLPLSPPAV